MSNKETQDQIAAVMLQTGTPEQQQDALVYCSKSDDAPNDVSNKETPKPVTALQLAMTVLKEVMTNDPDYAWSWQCNVAMSVFDTGVDHKTSNEAAARFIRLLCDVDMTMHPNYIDFEKQWLADKAKAALRGETIGQHNEIERLRRDCAEAYQIIGCIGMKSDNLIINYTDDDITRALDNLYAATAGEPRPHEDLLPWPQS